MDFSQICCNGFIYPKKKLMRDSVILKVPFKHDLLALRVGSGSYGTNLQGRALSNLHRSYRSRRGDQPSGGQPSTLTLQTLRYSFRAQPCSWDPYPSTPSRTHKSHFRTPSAYEWGVIEGTRKAFVFGHYLAFLWSTTHIELGTSMSPSGINDWILRSRTLPLTLHIQCFDHSKKEQSKKILADTMSLCSNRLQSLSLVVPSQVLCGLQHNSFQYHRLRQREKIVLVGRVSFRSLNISWNRLISATILNF